MKLKLVYRVELSSSEVVSALLRALTPDIKSLPSTCSGDISVSERVLNLVVECSSLSRARAVNNNLIGLVALLLRIVGEMGNERDSTREEPTTGNSAVTNTVPGRARAVREN
ncbi:MAG: KEOPS complex subunit Pcc1 [Desulfurococcaceae archaeon]